MKTSLVDFFPIIIACIALVFGFTINPFSGCAKNPACTALGFVLGVALVVGAILLIAQNWWMLIQ